MKNKIKWGFIYVLTFIVVFAISVVIKTSFPKDPMTTIEWNDTVGTIYTDIAYGDGEANKFDLYVPADTSRETYGLVVYLHPGGFTGGDKSGDAAMLRWLCAKGYVAAGINYTLLSDDNPSANVYTMSLDIKNAMPAVVEETQRLGYQLDGMAVAGGSAGGTLALLYAYRDADTSPVPVKMVFEAVGPASYHHEDWTSYGLNQSAEAAAALFSVMSGNVITTEMITANDYGDKVKDISADMWVTPNSVPAVLAYGTHDTVCPYLSAVPLVNALEANNIPHEFIVFPHSGHGLQNDSKQGKLYTEKIEEYLEMYLPVE